MKILKNLVVACLVSVAASAFASCPDSLTQNANGSCSCPDSAPYSNSNGTWGSAAQFYSVELNPQLGRIRCAYATGNNTIYAIFGNFSTSGSNWQQPDTSYACTESLSACQFTVN